MESTYMSDVAQNQIMETPPDIDVNSKDTLYCREYINYDALDKSPRPKDALLKTMMTGCSALEKLGIGYFISKGTALGFLRCGGFKKTEIDIDVDIICGDKDIYKLVRELPFVELFITSNKGHYQQFSLLDTETNVIFDLCIFHRRGNWLINRNYFGYYWLPANKVDNLVNFNFEGYSLPVLDLNWYCNFWYGPNWRTPKRYGKDWSVDYRKDCSGLIYVEPKDIVYENLYL